MNDARSPNSSPIILGRAFLSTVNIKIDVKRGTLTMEFDGKVVNFNIFNTMKYSYDSHTIFAMSVIDSLAQKLTKHLELGVIYDVQLSEELKGMVGAL